MAPNLRCPECNHRHPLTDVDDRETFRCVECGRLLRVPARLRAVITGPQPVLRPEGDGNARAGAATAVASPTRVAPTDAAHDEAGPGTQLLPPLVAQPRSTATPRLGMGWRVLVWIVGIPLGAIVGGLAANRLGVVTTTQLEDAFLESGVARFSPLVRLLPFWALATALFVTGVIALADAWLRRRASGKRQRSAEPEAVEPGETVLASTTGRATDRRSPAS